MKTCVLQACQHLTQTTLSSTLILPLPIKRTAASETFLTTLIITSLFISKHHKSHGCTSLNLDFFSNTLTQPQLTTHKIPLDYLTRIMKSIGQLALPIYQTQNICTLEYLKWHQSNRYMFDSFHSNDVQSAQSQRSPCTISFPTDFEWLLCQKTQIGDIHTDWLSTRKPFTVK